MKRDRYWTGRRGGKVHGVCGGQGAACGLQVQLRALRCPCATPHLCNDREMPLKSIFLCEKRR